MKNLKHFDRFDTRNSTPIKESNEITDEINCLMKYLKLFEAFNASEKNDKINQVVIYWAIKSFFNVRDWSIQIKDSVSGRKCFYISSEGKVFFSYTHFFNINRIEVDIYCTTMLLSYLNEKKLANKVTSNKRIRIPVVYKPDYFDKKVKNALQSAIHKLLLKSG